MPDMELNLVRALGEIEDRARYAREAIVDEHEGNLRHHVTELNALAGKVLAVIEAW